MTYDISTATSTPQLVAAVRARVKRGEIAKAFRQPLDQVWAFLRSHPGLHSGGHNLFLYHHGSMDSGSMNIDFGIQVVRSFDQEGPVRCVETPAGEVVTTIHRGPYDRLTDAHAALHSWCRQNSKRIGDFSWELYGDRTDDPAKLETAIFYLLRH
jgi:effector-binding domain-containing protein